MQRNDVAGAHAADTGKMCSRHWKAMLIGPETIGKEAGWERQALFPLSFPTT